MKTRHEIQYAIRCIDPTTGQLHGPVLIVQNLEHVSQFVSDLHQNGHSRVLVVERYVEVISEGSLFGVHKPSEN